MKKLFLLLALILWAFPADAQFADQSNYVGSSGGSANAQTLAVPNYALNVGVVIRGLMSFTNTGAMTLSVNGTAATPVKKQTLTGLAAMSGNEVIAGQVSEFLYDGVQFELFDNVALANSTTGTGSAVLAVSPTLTTPNLGTPSAVTLTNGIGLPVSTGLSGLGTGMATALGVNIGLAGAPVLFNGALGTPLSGVLTNATGLPISTGVNGLATGIATFLATPSSANLAAAVTNETGTGLLVFGTSPVLTTPNLGTPSAAVLTNATGLPNAGLVNSSLTIGTTNVALGAAATTLAGLSSVTSTTFVGALTGGASLDLPLTGGTLTGPLLGGGGTPLTFSINPPVVAGASQFIPLSVTTTALPSLVVERSTTYSAGATTSPSLYVGTLVDVTNAAAFVDGIDSELEITANTGAGGGAIEAIRGRCVMDSGVTNLGCWGGSFVAQARGSGTGGKGVESEVAQATVVAPTPPSIVIGNLNVSYLASSGLNGDGGQIVDAAFMVNPFSTDGFQAGFECPKENSAGTVVRYACFEGAETATFGLDLSLGHWSSAAINATGFFVTNAGVASTTQLLLSTAASNFISASNTNSGSGSSVVIQGNNGTTNITGLVVAGNGTLQAPNLPTSAGSGGLFVCVDTSGNLYKKSTCP